MAGIYHPSRGGVRGGQDQFNWDDVKEDKDRECYIGHSLMVPTGKWQEGKDIFWYTRGKDGRSEAEKTRAEEIRKVKEIEARAMEAVLGKKTFILEKPLSKQDMHEALSRGKIVHEDGERIQGMGYKNTFRDRRSSTAKYGTEFQGESTDATQVTLVNKSAKKKKKKEKKKVKDKRREDDEDDSYCRSHDCSKREKHRNSEREGQGYRHCKDKPKKSRTNYDNRRFHSPVSRKRRRTDS